MNLNWQLMTLACVASCTGCATIPDSSLIYGSKQIVGIGLEKDATGSQIPGFNIGYISQNFAKVPVAVSLGEKGSNDDVHLIWGTSCSGNAQQDSACFAVHSDSPVVVSDTKAIANKTGMSKEIVEETIDDQLAELGFIKQQMTPSDKAVYSAAAVPEAFSINRLQDSIAKDLSAKSDSQSETKSQETKKALQEDLQLKLASDVVRKDAHSVFGTFAVKGDTSEAEIGNLFSTGVAAQISAAALRHQLQQRCIEAYKSALGDGKPSFEDLAKVCGNE